MTNRGRKELNDIHEVPLDYHFVPNSHDQINAYGGEKTGDRVPGAWVPAGTLEAETPYEDTRRHKGKAEGKQRKKGR